MPRWPHLAGCVAPVTLAADSAHKLAAALISEWKGMSAILGLYVGGARCRGRVLPAILHIGASIGVFSGNVDWSWGLVIRDVWQLLVVLVVGRICISGWGRRLIRRGRRVLSVMRVPRRIRICGRSRTRLRHSAGLRKLT